MNEAELKMRIKEHEGPVRCPYCGEKAQLVRGARVYPGANMTAHYYMKWFWLCEPCRAWVGTHKDDPRYTPLGRLANAELRRAKQQAHAAFDPIWKHGAMTRERAYKWLARAIGRPDCAVHIGEMDVEACVEVVRVCTTWALENPKARYGRQDKSPRGNDNYHRGLGDLRKGSDKLKRRAKGDKRQGGKGHKM